MTILKAFRAYRPRPDLATQVASLPYDVVSRTEAQELAAGNPYSFLRIVRSEIELPAECDPYAPQVYQRAKDNFLRAISAGIFIQEEQPALYVYRLRRGDQVQTGVVGLSAVDDYDQGIIKIHEKTRADKEEDRLRHLLNVGAHCGPVFLTHRPDAAIEKLSAATAQGRALYDFQAVDGVQHTLWRVDDPEPLCAAFQALAATYVADGHHRAKCASRCRAQLRESRPGFAAKHPANHFLSVLFPSDQLRILPYNRAIKRLNRDWEQIRAEIEQSFVVTAGAAPSPADPGTFTLYHDGGWYLLSPAKTWKITSDPVSQLDVSILQDKLLNPVFGIGDPRTDDNITFVGGIRGTKELERLVDSGQAAVAFALYPVAIDSLLTIADAGLLMPPKSTWFEPKLRSGLLVHRFLFD